MRLRDVIPFALVGGLAAFIVVQRRSLAPRPPAPAPPARVVDSVSPETAPEDAAAIVPTAVVTMDANSPPSPPRDDADISRRIADGAPGTYIREMLEQEGRLLMRWPDRRLTALRVWIERRSTVANWTPQFPLVAERVFDEWRDAGFPVRFDFQPDSAGASIQIRWTARIGNGQQIGVTSKTRDQHGWIVRAGIVIATHDPRGQPLSHETIAGVARHEVGHALGLGHSASPTDVMFPESRTPVISGADRATLHLLYTVPPGIVK